MTSRLSASKRSVAVVKLDVVGGCGSGLQTNGLADDKGDGLGLRLAHSLGGGGAALGLVQHLVRQFMHKRAENSSAFD